MSKQWNIALWILQAMLAIAFIAAGGMKLVSPIADLAQSMSWVHHSAEGLVRFIGLAELLGGLGLVLPAATRIIPVLTPVAAAALTLVMSLAIGTHLMLAEGPMAGAPLLLGILTATVAYGRFKKAPIAPR